MLVPAWAERVLTSKDSPLAGEPRTERLIPRVELLLLLVPLLWLVVVLLLNLGDFGLGGACDFGTQIGRPGG